MFWLASGIFIGAAIPFYGYSLQEMRISSTVVESQETARGDLSRDAWLTSLDADPLRIALRHTGTQHSPAEAEHIQGDTRAENELTMAAVSAIAWRIIWGKFIARVLFLCSLVFCASAIGGFVRSNRRADIEE
jgi:hypothetical protein